jgi:hypothetical protein
MADPRQRHGDKALEIRRGLRRLARRTGEARKKTFAQETVLQTSLGRTMFPQRRPERRDCRPVTRSGGGGPLVDGNKRTAFLAAYAFLGLSAFLAFECCRSALILIAEDMPIVRRGLRRALDWPEKRRCSGAFRRRSAN